MTIIGVSRRTYPRESQPGEPSVDGWHPDGAPVTVVLVLGDPAVGDYAAYCGQGSDVWVAHHGDKLSFEEAAAHFPGALERERYRR